MFDLRRRESSLSLPACPDLRAASRRNVDPRHHKQRAEDCVEQELVLSEVQVIAALTHGDYRIVAAMPDRDGDHMYRIKSPLEEYERVVKEGLLVKSNGYLPEETPTRVSRYSSITLPTLQPA
jgi:hypothetical protein